MVRQKSKSWQIFSRGKKIQALSCVMAVQRDKKTAYGFSAFKSPLPNISPQKRFKFWNGNLRFYDAAASFDDCLLALYCMLQAHQGSNLVERTQRAFYSISCNNYIDIFKAFFVNWLNFCLLDFGGGVVVSICFACEHLFNWLTLEQSLSMTWLHRGSCLPHMVEDSRAASCIQVFRQRAKHIEVP